MVRSREPTSGGSSRAPVASTKNVSPSFSRWDGRTARAKPLWAAPASRWASARCSRASVATTPMVVLSGGGGGGQGQRAAAATTSARAGRRTGGSVGRRAGAPYSAPVVGSSTRPAALTATSAATVEPSSRIRLAEPMPPASGPAAAPAAAPTLPSTTAAGRRPRRGPCGRRVAERRPGAMAERPTPTEVEEDGGRARSGRPGRGSGPTGKPTPCSSNHAITPSAAASP